MVVLSPDVAKVFRTSESVNEALRTLVRVWEKTIDVTEAGSPRVIKRSRPGCKRLRKMSLTHRRFRPKVQSEAMTLFRRSRQRWEAFHSVAADVRRLICSRDQLLARLSVRWLVTTAFARAESPRRRERLSRPNGGNQGSPNRYIRTSGKCSGASGILQCLSRLRSRQSHPGVSRRP